MSPILADGLLILVTMVWGSTFVIVKNAIATVGPLTFVAVRFFIAGMVLLAWHVVRAGSKWYRASRPFYLGSILTGLALCFSYITQTLGLVTVSAGKTAFITGLYVVFVPVASKILLRAMPDAGSVAGVLLATVGLGLLSLTFPLQISSGDFLVFLCSLGFAAHILLVEVYGDKGSAFLFTAIQLLVVSVLCFILALLYEYPLVIPAHSWTAIVYMALAGTSFTFLVQSSVQRFTSATHTALIFSAEPVFGAFFAWAMLGEVLSPKELWGASCVLVGMFVSEAGVLRSSASRTKDANT